MRPRHIAAALFVLFTLAFSATPAFHDRAALKRGVPAAVLLALAAALIVAVVVWMSVSGLPGADDAARNMAAHPIVRMPAQLGA